MERDKYCGKCGKKLQKVYTINDKKSKSFVGWLKCTCYGTKQKVLRGNDE